MRRSEAVTTIHCNIVHTRRRGHCCRRADRGAPGQFIWYHTRYHEQRLQPVVICCCHVIRSVRPQSLRKRGHAVRASRCKEFMPVEAALDLMRSGPSTPTLRPLRRRHPGQMLVHESNTWRSDRAYSSVGSLLLFVTLLISGSLGLIWGLLLLGKTLPLLAEEFANLAWNMSVTGRT